MSIRKLLIQRLIISLLNIPIFYYAFLIFSDLGKDYPLQLFIVGNLFNILMLIIAISVQTVLWLAIDSPAFRQWLLTIERNPRSVSSERQKGKAQEKKKRKAERFF